MLDSDGKEDKKLIFAKKSKTAGKSALTKDQALKLLNIITDIEDQALLTLAIYCGFRRSDLVSIERNNINFDKHELIFYEHKKRAYHKVALHPKVEQALQMWISRSKSKWLFPSHYSNKNTHISSRTAYNILQRNLKKANLPSVPIHALRATCIKLHQAAGLTMRQSADIINDSIKTVEAHYTTTSDEEMKKMIRSIDIL